jgi:S-formylglutathione hydrolase FrmB
MAVLTVRFFSKCLRREVTMSALLPVDSPEFGEGQASNASSGQPLKSLYLLHGIFGSHEDWLHNSRIRVLSDRYQFAVFMPAGENRFYLDNEERDELYGEFIGHELVEMTRRMFPLSAAREDTFIGGLSMGGYGAIRNGLKYADRFGSIIALSSALLPYRIANATPDYHDGITGYAYLRSVFGDLSQLLGSDKDPEALVRQLKSAGKEIPRIYMACGTEDFLLDTNRLFHEFLLREEVDHVYIEAPGAHTWDFWARYIEKGLVWAKGAASR